MAARVENSSIRLHVRKNSGIEAQKGGWEFLVYSEVLVWNLYLCSTIRSVW